MDLYGKKCPVCDKYLHADDDVVVCPDCGTPYHRECYLENGECIFKSKHEEMRQKTEEFKENKNNDSADTGSLDKIICPNCSSENRKEAVFCDKCGFRLKFNPNNAENVPPVPMAVMLDPMGGVDPKQEMEENVTAGDMAKFVKVSPPYYMRVFSRIKNQNKSRFNFAAFFFSGGWMLYRKIYAKGIAICSLLAVLIISYYLSFSVSQPVLEGLLSNLNISTAAEYLSQADYLKLAEAVQSLPIGETFKLFLPNIITFCIFILSLVVGIIGNRMYYKHCTKKIQEIKKENQAESEISNKLQASGGVNVAIAISLFVSLFLLTNLASYFMLR